MTAGALFVVLLALAVTAFVVAPLLRKDAAEAERVAVAVSEEMELESRRNMVLAALRDLEEDRATGKIDDRDFEELHARLSAQAVEIMKRTDELRATPPAAGPRAVPPPRTEPPASPA